MIGTILRKNLRALLIYVTLAFIFACAWIADEHPGVVMAATVFAVVGIVLLLCLELLEKYLRFKPNIESPAGMYDDDDKKTLNDRRSRATTFEWDRFRDTNKSLFPVVSTVKESRRLRRIRGQAELIAKNVVINAVSTNVSIENDAMTVVSPKTYRILDKLDVAEYEGEAFSVSAGMFEIEHIDGHTIIRVHNIADVTVEGFSGEQYLPYKSGRVTTSDRIYAADKRKMLGT